eukprot:scaffold167193_cov20-Tisochrysis_lutea.AAC.2
MLRCMDVEAVEDVSAVDVQHRAVKQAIAGKGAFALHQEAYAKDIVAGQNELDGINAVPSSSQPDSLNSLQSRAVGQKDSLPLQPAVKYSLTEQQAKSTAYARSLPVQLPACPLPGSSPHLHRCVHRSKAHSDVI